MKELATIIDKLHKINQKVAEKDNLINAYDTLFDLFDDLVSDEKFRKSEIYLELRLKYISKIEEQLTKISKSTVDIEPMNTIGLSGNGSRYPKINGPLPTDIFMAPGQRRRTIAGSGKHKLKKNNTKQTKDHVGTSYVEFSHDGISYYIDTTPSSNNSVHYIYNYDESGRFTVAGNLEKTLLTLLAPGSDQETVKIQIKKGSDSNGNSQVSFSDYIIV